MTRQTDHVVKTGVQSASNPYKFILSDETVDRMGDVIRAKGWDLSNFKSNAIALFGHDHGFPIGTWKDVKVEGRRLVGTLELAKQGTSDRIDEIRSLIEQGILKAVSVGFSIKDYVPMDKSEPYGGWDIKEAELHETSVVSVPANPSAVLIAKSFGVSQETLDLVFGAKGKTAPLTRQKSGVLAPKRKSLSKGRTPMDLKSKIADAEQRLEELRDEVVSINKSAGEEARDLHDEEADLITQYGEQIDALAKSIGAMKRSEELMGKRAIAASASKAKPRYAVAAKEEKAGTLFAKMAVATMQAERERKSVLQVATERFEQSDERIPALVKAFMTKSAADVATTTNDGWASQLAINETMGFIEALNGVSVYGALSAMGLALPFGNANSITMPYRNGRGGIAGSFVQENGTIPVKQLALTSKTFNRFKLAVLTAMTNEIIDVSQPGIVEIVRRSILDDTAETIDAHAISTLAGVAGVRPPGLLVGANNQAATTPAGDALNEILTDLRWLRLQLLNANAYRNPAYLMHPANADALALVTNASGAFVFPSVNADGGTLLGTRVITSTHLDPEIVTLTDAADWATAYGDPSFEMSQSATLVMVGDDGTDPSMYHSTNQTPGVDVAGSVNVSDAAGVTGGPAQVRSMFQTNSTALRMLMPISYGTLREGTTAYITGVAW